MSESVPIKDVLADPEHPAHGAAKDMMAKMASGEINLCACMGPMYGEPYCACEMRRRDLPRSQECWDAIAAAQERLQALFGPGGAYANPQMRD